MSHTPFMPLWVSDFLGDTLDLDAKEIGAYMLLLMAMWQRGGTLPNDNKKLQRVARVGRDWPKIWAGLEHYFVADGETITNRRLMREVTKVAAKRAVNAHSGSLGGRANALKNKERTQANALATITRTINEESYDSSSGQGEIFHGNERAGETDAAPGNDPETGETEPGRTAAADRDGAQAGDAGDQPDRQPDKPKPPAKGSRIASDFWPDGTTQRVFGECGGTDLGAWVEQFVDYWSSRSGAAATKRDWQATARNRIRQCHANGWAEPGLPCGAGGRRNGNAEPPGRADLEMHFAAAARVGAEWQEEVDPMGTPAPGSGRMAYN